ncbi:UTP--glucose-1-phosphate uridylyltransferase GalU [Ignatzschineria sp. LJL83]
MTKIRKAILPVAGLGTRFLPASKAIPKEMVTVVDRPVIDYVVQEAVNAGIEEIILVTHPSKASIENYFDKNFELETILQEKNKLDILAEIEAIIPPNVKVMSVRQGAPLGLGHAVLCAKPLVGKEPFAVLLPDVLVYNGQDSQFSDNDLKTMMTQFEKAGHAQIMVEEVPSDLVDQYGIVDVAEAPLKGESIQMQGIVEKPAIGRAPSNLSVIGRYILPASIMELLEKTPKGAGNEIQLTDAIAMLQQESAVDAYRMHGKTFDCGSKIGYLEAILHYGVSHPVLGSEFKKMVQTTCDSMND